jgi:hypothetical protein
MIRSLHVCKKLIPELISHPCHRGRLPLLGIWKLRPWFTGNSRVQDRPSRMCPPPVVAHAGDAIHAGAQSLPMAIDLLSMSQSCSSTEIAIRQPSAAKTLN